MSRYAGAPCARMCCSSPSSPTNRAPVTTTAPVPSTRRIERVAVDWPGGDALAVRDQRHVAEIDRPWLRPPVAARDLEKDVLDAVCRAGGRRELLQPLLLLQPQAMLFLLANRILV